MAESIGQKGIFYTDVTVNSAVSVSSGVPAAFTLRIGITREMSVTSASISLTYTVSTINAVGFTNSTVAYQRYSNSITNAVSTGLFTAYMQQNAINNNAFALETSIASQLPTFQLMLPTSSPTSPPAPSASNAALSGGAIAGITIACFVVVALGGVLVWRHLQNTTSSAKSYSEDKSSLDQKDVKSAESLARRGDASNPIVSMNSTAITDSSNLS